MNSQCQTCLVKINPSRNGRRKFCATCAQERIRTSQINSRRKRGVAPRVVRKINDLETLCTGCNQIKANNQFNQESRRFNGLSFYCRACVKIKRPDVGNSPNAILAKRKNHLRSKYQLSIEEYTQMYLDQDGCCWICEEPRPVLHVDHDHQTGKVRGLLCQSCNHGLGNFKDMTDRLERAARYLMNYQNVLGVIK